MKISILFIIICILVLGCERDKVSITDIQKGFAFNLTKPEYLVGSRPGNLIEFEGYLRSINENVNSIKLVWVSDIDGIFRETYTNSSGYIHFYYDELSNDFHNIYVVLTEPYLDQPDTLNYFTIYNNMPESIDLNMHRFIGMFNDNLYFIGDFDRTWSHSDSLAQLNDMHLVTVTSEYENTFIKYALPNDDYYEFDNYWIGLYFNPENNIVEWTTGEPVGFTGYTNQSQMPDFEHLFGYVYDNGHYSENLNWGSEVSTDSSSSWQSYKNYIAEYEGNK